MMIKEKFAKAILRQRLSSELKLTQRDVAEEAGVSLRYYQSLEAGKKMPSLDTLDKLARAHSMRLSELCRIIEETD